LTWVACAQERRPNILLIMTDNQSHSLLGAYGNEEIKTPNIDRLAHEGIKFNQAFAVNGVCSPTRATLLTGLIPSQTGIHVALPSGTGVEGWAAIEEFRSLPQTLAEAGYRTGLVGKYHLGEADEPQLGFQYWVTFPSGHTTTFYGQSVIDNGRTHTVDGHLTDFWTERAVEFLSHQSHDQPFFLYLAYNGPYMLPPTVNMEPRSRYAAYYTQNMPTFPRESTPHPYVERWARGRGPSDVMIDEGTTAARAIDALTNPAAVINTAAETTLVDEGIGKVMEALEEYGFDETTLVVFTSDQAASYGQHGFWGNTSWSFPFTVYNVNMQIPLIFRHSGHLPANVELDELVGQYDFFPTILDYLGMQHKEIANTPGKSYAPLLSGEDIEWDDAVFFEFVTVRAIRTPKWKYMKRFDRDEPDTLYDMEADPGETTNLIDDPAYREIVEELDQRLTAFFETYADAKYDLWKGGTAKGRLLEEHYGRDDVFRDRFPDWHPPVVEKAETAFSDLN
jgi:arylsulfatase A-like enzyme